MNDSVLCRFETDPIPTAAYHAPMNKLMVLPVELLRMILRLVYPPPLPDPLGVDDSDSDPPYPKSIITLSSVCRLWRNAVVKDPTFWSFISLPSNPLSVEMLISRSGQTPLVVHILFTEDVPSRSMCTMIFNEYHRFQRLSFDIDDKLEQYPPEWELILSFMSRPAPMLESLHFVTTNPPPRLDGLLKGGAPQMKELYIRGECVPPLSFTSLRVLDIAMSLAYCDDTESYENLLVLLTTNPQLESLTFNVESLEFPITADRPPINLPYLKNLFIHTTQRRLPDLQGLVLSPDTRTLLEVFEDDDSDVPFSLHSSINILKIKLDIKTCAVSAIQTYDHEESLFSIDSCSASRPPFVLEDNIFSAYDLSNVTDLSLEFYDKSELHFTKTEYESFKNIFWCLPNLRCLEVEHRNRDVEEADEPKMPYLDGLMNPVQLDELPCTYLADLDIIHPTASLSYANQLKQCILARLATSRTFPCGVRIFECTKLHPEVRTLLDGLVEWEEECEDI